MDGAEQRWERYLSLSDDQPVLVGTRCAPIAQLDDEGAVAAGSDGAFYIRVLPDIPEVETDAEVWTIHRVHDAQSLLQRPDGGLDIHDSGVQRLQSHSCAVLFGEIRHRLIFSRRRVEYLLDVPSRRYPGIRHEGHTRCQIAQALDRPAKERHPLLHVFR